MKRSTASAEGPRVSTRIVAEFVDFACRRGTSREQLARSLRVAVSELCPGDSWVSLEWYLRLVDAARALCREPAIALHFGYEVSLDQMSPAGLAARASATVEESISRLNRYWRLDIDDRGAGPKDRICVRRADNDLWVELTDSPALTHCTLIETSLARMAGGFARAFAPCKLARRVAVSFPDPGYGGVYERVFDAPVEFGGSRNAIAVDPEILSWSTPDGGNEYLVDLVEDRAAIDIAEGERRRTACGRVEQLLREQPAIEASATRVSSQLGWSRATLYRRLRQEGTNFRELAREVRREVAERLLLRDELTIAQVALRLGFSDASAFSRGFKTWTGVAPAEWRRDRVS